jgi:hypothetical protein
MSEIIEINVNDFFYGKILLDKNNVLCVAFDPLYKDEANCEQWQRLRITLKKGADMVLEFEEEEHAKKVYSQIEKHMTV